MRYVATYITTLAAAHSYTCQTSSVHCRTTPVAGRWFLACSQPQYERTQAAASKLGWFPHLAHRRHHWKYSTMHLTQYGGVVRHSYAEAFWSPNISL